MKTSTTYPDYDLIIFDDDYHYDDTIEHLLYYYLQISKPEVGTIITELRNNKCVTVMRTWFERGEHYKDVLTKKSAGLDVTQLDRSIYVELNKVIH